MKRHNIKYIIVTAVREAGSGEARRHDNGPRCCACRGATCPGSGALRRTHEQQVQISH
jgi:hypothetical protein